jgi:hypothetical protein
MIKKRQMCRNRAAVQLSFTVRGAVLNKTFEQAFQSWHAGFRPASINATVVAA